MKRRGFLQMLGGAFAAPLLPSASFGAATKVAYPASALHAAIYHAQSRVNFSVFSLATQLGLQLGQAEQLMSDMSARGILGPLQGTTQSGRWAISKVWHRPVADAVAARNLAKDNRTAKAAKATVDPTSQYSEPDMSGVLARVYDICRSQGIALHPRCAVFAKGSVA